MERVTRLLSAARKIDGLTQTDAAKILGLSEYSYQRRESSPADFRLRELMRLAEAMSPTARGVVAEAVSSIFLPDD